MTGMLYFSGRQEAQVVKHTTLYETTLTVTISVATDEIDGRETEIHAKACLDKALAAMATADPRINALNLRLAAGAYPRGKVSILSTEIDSTINIGMDVTPPDADQMR